jgi:type VI secretion system secreted protein Hcp
MPASKADYFLNIDTIPGESNKKGFEKQIEIESFSWSESQGGSHGSGSGGGEGKVSWADFSFSTKENVSSPKLMLACANGQHITKAVLSCRKAGGTQQVYLTYTLTKLHITSYVTNGAGGDFTIPTDTFTIGFKKMEISYKPQNDDGSLGAAITVQYDVSTTS